jgi:hypothetical protein
VAAGHGGGGGLRAAFNHPALAAVSAAPPHLRRGVFSVLLMWLCIDHSFRLRSPENVLKRGRPSPTGDCSRLFREIARQSWLPTFFIGIGDPRRAWRLLGSPSLLLERWGPGKDIRLKLTQSLFRTLLRLLQRRSGLARPSRH